jgi:amino acid adenylation domain-containing protein
MNTAMNTVIELFQKVCREHAADTAVEVGGQRYTYEQFHRFVQSIAQEAARRGVKAGDLVGILLPRDVRLPAAKFASLGLGTIFVPLIDKYPRERIEALTKMHGIRYVFTSEELLPLLGADCQPIVVPPTGFTAAGDWTPAKPQGDRSLYVIFTSGSTGLPKGVLIQESSLLNLIEWTKGCYTPEELRSVLAATLTTFDLSIFELICTLCLGGKIVLVNSVLDLLSHEGELDVTLINTVPSAAKELVRFNKFPKATRVVNLAGEALFQDLVSAIYAVGTVDKVFNLYGPSEDTTYSTGYLAQRSSPDKAVKIGVSLPGKVSYILDEQLQPLPDGEAGEICLGGEGLSAGYLNDAELTAKKFVTVPSGPLKGVRLYKTGDLGKRDEQGELRYLGRVDRQIKVRGVRIEPGEVESALRSIDGVLDAAVMKIRDGNSNDHLVAFVATQRTDLRSEAILDAMASKVPEFMVPSRVEQLRTIPLNTNGKVNYLELEVIGRKLFQTTADPVLDNVGEKTRTMVSALLGGKAVDDKSDFFKLGGNSLLSAQLAFQLQKEFSVSLNIADIFKHRVMDDLTQLVKGRMSAKPGEAAPQTRTEVKKEVRGPAAPAEKVPATFLQRAIWLLEHSPKGKGVSNAAFHFDYAGSLDRGLLDSCLKRLIDLHPILKTTYHKDGDALLQKVKPYNSFSLRTVDLDGLSDEERQAAIEEIANDETTKTFDLSKDLMVRVTDVRFGESDGLLIFVFHHIAVDEQSLKVYFTDLSRLYQAGGNVQALPRRASRSYLDYAQEEAAAQARGDMQPARDYWLKQLSGFQGGTPYPALRAGSTEKSFEGGHHYHVLAEEVSARFEAAAQEKSVTPFALFSSAMTYLVHQASGESDVSLGAFISCRDHFTERDTVGFFVNTLPLRTRVENGASVDGLVEAVSTTLIDAHAYRHVALEGVLEELRLDAEVRRAMFRVMVTIEPEQADEFALGEAHLRRKALDRGISKYDLLLSLRKEKGVYRLLVESSARYSKEEIALLCRNVEAAIDLVSGDGSRKVSATHVLPREAAPTLRSKLGWTRGEPIQGQPLPRLFQAAMKGREEQVAITDSQGSITYRVLDQRSDAVAVALRERGVRPGSVVAVCEERRGDTMAALLGVMKAGATYAVFDTQLPPERLRKMKEACGAMLLVGSQRPRQNLPANFLPELDLDEACNTRTNPAMAQSFMAEQDAERAAYICFTSGTSGEPKAVAVPHRAVTRIVHGKQYVQLSERDVFLNISPLSFDGSVFEVWSPLSRGARLVLMPDGAFSLEQVAERLTGEKVSIIFITTQLFNALVDKKMDALMGVSQILFGGEKASAAHVRRLLERGYPGKVSNIYGPTETAVFAASHLIDARHPERYQDSVPIGQALDDTSLVILNRNQGLAPIGVAGEVAIGGPGVASGYLNAPELTQARFRTLRFEGLGDGRFYLSGDIGMVDEEGQLHYVGRRDRQVKVSGFRIELDEVEAVIARAPGVRGCYCLVDGALVAYVAHGGDASAEAAIRAHARTHLPKYMVPQHFVFMEQLPLGKTGKVDAKLLPAVGSVASGEGSAPATEVASTPRPAPQPVKKERIDVAELIREIWSKELQISSFSDDDNFFDIGGSSLRIMNVHEELSRALERTGSPRKLEIMELFEHPTVTALSDFLREVMGDEHVV